MRQPIFLSADEYRRAENARGKRTFENERHFVDYFTCAGLVRAWRLVGGNHPERDVAKGVRRVFDRALVRHTLQSEKQLIFLGKYGILLI